MHLFEYSKAKLFGGEREIDCLDLKEENKKTKKNHIQVILFSFVLKFGKEE